MKKNIFMKSLVIMIITLFVTINIVPTMAMEQNKEKVNEKIVSVNFLFEQKYSLTDEECSNLITKLSLLSDELRSTNSKEDLINILNSNMNLDTNSLLNRIIQYILNSELLNNRKLVISQGGGYNLNIFKDSKIGVIKPLTFWHYNNDPSLFTIPSSTLIISLNPFKINTFSGAQMGLMLRFRGLYVQVSQPLPQKSYTFFIGSASHAGGIEFNPLSSIF